MPTITTRESATVTALALLTSAPAILVTSITAASVPKLVVLDIQLTGDQGGPQLTAEHAVRLKNESEILRRQLASTGLYELLDTTPAQELINRLTSQQAYWHDCNGSELLADQVLVTWVDRVSGLILSLTYELHDVAGGQILGRKSYDFRGDNDNAWTHAIVYMVRDLKGAQGSAANPNRP